MNEKDLENFEKILNTPLSKAPVCETCGAVLHPYSSQACTCNIKRKEQNWETYFRDIAKVVATKSKDPKTNIGAVIVGTDNEIVSTGYNSFPRGLNDNVSARFERPEKYFWFEHAERNAIYNAARIGVPTKGCTMYLDHWFPCADCARGIINAGITTVYCEPLDDDEDNPQYMESFVKSKEMLLEAGVRLKYYKE